MCYMFKYQFEFGKWWSAIIDFGVSYFQTNHTHIWFISVKEPQVDLQYGLCLFLILGIINHGKSSDENT